MAGSDPYSSTSHLVYLPGVGGEAQAGEGGGCAGAPVIIARAPPVISGYYRYGVMILG